MVWWIVGALLLSAAVILVLAVRPLFARLTELRRAVERLRRRQTEAAALQQTAEALNEQVAALTEQAETASRRLALIKARRG